MKFPHRPLKALFQITNPVTLISNLFSLFLAKPLGTRSQLQKMFEVQAELL
jgi:hypothetical protein